ncbi:hypothetical protein TYRP_001165 [Tyrophagus putrescentiae]|nr:hypothetical protein TYRP_001165 [Tyrophagus putrescentiae]
MAETPLCPKVIEFLARELHLLLRLVLLQEKVALLVEEGGAELLRLSIEQLHLGEERVEGRLSGGRVDEVVDVVLVGVIEDGRLLLKAVGAGGGVDRREEVRLAVDGGRQLCLLPSFASLCVHRHQRSDDAAVGAAQHHQPGVHLLHLK